MVCELVAFVLVVGLVVLAWQGCFGPEAERQQAFRLMVLVLLVALLVVVAVPIIFFGGMFLVGAASAR